MSDEIRAMTMRVIQRRDIIRGVRKLWTEQYKEFPDNHRFFCGTTVVEIRERLAKLDLETCSAEDIDTAIGAAWAKNECEECGASFDVVIRLGQEPDYESRYWDICLGCLDKARDLLASTDVIP